MGAFHPTKYLLSGELHIRTAVGRDYDVSAELHRRSFASRKRAENGSASSVVTVALEKQLREMHGDFTGL